MKTIRLKKSIRSIFIGLIIMTALPVMAVSDNSTTGKGQLSIRCDKQDFLEGAEVTAGGKLSFKGEKVTLSNGFSVKAGAKISITTN